MKRQRVLQLADKSRDELIEDILHKEDIIAQQQKRIRDLEKKLGVREQADEQRKLLKLMRCSQKVKDPKTPGRKKGHAGVTRVKPEKIDRVVELELTHCPDCHHPVGKSQEVIEHIQEDISPAHVEVTCFKKHRHWCPCCEKLVTAPPAPDEIPNSYIGPNALVQTILLKYHHALPFNKISELFESLAGLRVTEGALSQALQRMSEWLKVETDVILAAIRASPLLHMDETGWKVNGDRHWVWATVNKLLAYYRIARSRGAKIPREILSEKYEGTLIADFYSAYNRLKLRIQRCLVHLEREMRRCLLRDASKEYAQYHKVLKRIIQDARNLKTTRQKFAPAVYIRKVSLIRKRLLRWACREHENKNLKRLAQRIMKHATELLVFLEDPGVPADNNFAERMIRSHVIIRNRSFQNRSNAGAKAHETMMSLLHTLRLQEKNPLEFFRKAILRHSQGSPAPVLAL